MKDDISWVELLSLPVDQGLVMSFGRSLPANRTPWLSKTNKTLDPRPNNNHQFGMLLGTPDDSRPPDGAAGG